MSIKDSIKEIKGCQSRGEKKIIFKIIKESIKDSIKEIKGCQSRGEKKIIFKINNFYLFKHFKHFKHFIFLVVYILADSNLYRCCILFILYLQMLHIVHNFILSDAAYCSNLYLQMLHIVHNFILSDAAYCS